MTDREIVRCASCQLNQFTTATEKCRKCGKPLREVAAPDLPEPIKIAVVAPPSERTDGFDIARAVLLLRRLRGYSQNGLAKSIKVPRTYISKIENRHCIPTIPSLCRLAEALGISPFMLMSIAEAAGEAA